VILSASRYIEHKLAIYRTSIAERRKDRANGGRKAARERERRRRRRRERRKQRSAGGER